MAQTVIKLSLASLVLCAVVVAYGRADTLQAWAYPINPPGASEAMAEGILHVPGSDRGFTGKELKNISGPICDWYPQEHPVPPAIVTRGKPGVYACGYCHLPDGSGRPENASLAGLQVAYIRREVLAFSRDQRLGSVAGRGPEAMMTALAKGLTIEELDDAAAYFSSLKPSYHLKVIETDEVPKTVISGWTYRVDPKGGTEPLGRRIVEMPEDFERFKRRDPKTPYLVYVPVGSVERGADLVASGAHGRSVACITCHGPDLKGFGDAPRILGRSPSYIARQLTDLREGKRLGAMTALMIPVAARLTDDDILEIAAYLSSRQP